MKCLGRVAENEAAIKEKWATLEAEAEKRRLDWLVQGDRWVAQLSQFTGLLPQ